MGIRRFKDKERNSGCFMALFDRLLNILLRDLLACSNEAFHYEHPQGIKNQGVLAFALRIA